MRNNGRTSVIEISSGEKISYEAVNVIFQKVKPSVLDIFLTTVEVQVSEGSELKGFCLLDIPIIRYGFVHEMEIHEVIIKEVLILFLGRKMGDWPDVMPLKNPAIFYLGLVFSVLVDHKVCLLVL
ncbi:hypothetical protein DGG96_14450 [Legionella qingyii]|uniref:Uncharacterized protein n=1 Tax=Legionella qingyii TaxID=2184757 RepID=A0A317U0P5_9GAMM|nr:hypothetical protein DGG96_14450 [Legionella qingyii]